MVCTDPFEAASFEARPCLIVSVGSNGDFSFETAVHAAYPRCTIHVFDGTPGKSDTWAKLAPKWLTYHATHFYAGSWKSFVGAGSTRRLPTVTVLKMDCEGCEFEALPSFLEHTCTEQVLCELHGTGTGPRSSVGLLKHLNASYGVYYAEPAHSMLLWRKLVTQLLSCTNKCTSAVNSLQLRYLNYIEEFHRRSP